MSAFVHTQSIKTVNAGGGGVKKWQNSVHVVVECPLKGQKTEGKIVRLVNNGLVGSNVIYEWAHGVF